jgi:hypothetical protein
MIGNKRAGLFQPVSDEINERRDETVKRILSFLCSLALLLGMIVPATTITAQAANQGRTIAVVYDNSGSMYGQENDRWSQALYAMEVFASMLEEDDTLKLYPLNPENGGAVVSISGSDAPDTRISKLVSSLNDAYANASSHNTPYQQVKNAASDLTAGEDSWLVVLTDGVFTDAAMESDSAVLKSLTGYGDSGLNVVFLGVGTGAADLSSSTDSSRNFYAYHSGEGSDVLDKVATIANLIFQQQLLPASHITTSGNTMTLDIDVPVSRLVVFAQGSGNSSLTLSDSNGTMAVTAQASPEITEADRPVGQETSLIGSGLQGVVSSYVGHYSPGTYTLTAGDTSQVQIYYIADVELDCILKDGDEVLSSSDQHASGTYSLEWSFVDDNGTAYQSDLLNIEHCTGTLTNKTTGEVTDLDRATDSVTLEEGEYELSAEAVLEGSDAAITCEHNYIVYPAPINLELTVTEAPTSYSTATLGTDGQAMVIKVTNADTGEALSEAEWQATELTIAGGDLAYTWERGDEVSTFRVWPECPAGTSVSQLEGGAVDLNMEASYTIGNQTAYGKNSGAISFQLIAMKSLELQVTLTPPEDAVDLGTFFATQKKSTGEVTADESSLAQAEAEAQNVGNYVRLDVLAKNAYTGSFEPLTDDQRKNLELTLTGTSENGAQLNWSATYNSDGYWELKPNYTQIVAFSWKNVDWSSPTEGKEVSVSVSATAGLMDNGMPYVGNDGPVTVTVRTMSLLSLIGQIIVWIVVIALIIFLLIGYLGKKKLKLSKKKVSYYGIKPPSKPHPVAPQRVWSTYLLPYVPQRAKIYIKNKACNCSFPEIVIVATRRNGMFHLVTYDKFLTTKGKPTSIRVNGTEYYKNEQKDRDKLKNKEFSSLTLNFCKNGIAIGEGKIN